MDITKLVIKTGGGDYTDLFVGFNDMLVSGLAATGSILSYLLVVDDAEYTGSFSGYIPYSGNFIIKADQPLVTLTSPSMVSGSFGVSRSQLTLDGFVFDCSGLSNYAFIGNSGCNLSLSNSEFINCNLGVVPSGGVITTDNISAHGPGTGAFINGSGQVTVTNSKISNYASGICTYNSSITNSNIFNNTTNITALVGGSTLISNSLLYGGTYGVNVPSGSLSIAKSTIASTFPIKSSGTYISILESILNGSNVCISGTYISGSIVQNCATYPSGWDYSANLSGNNNSILEPKFNNASLGDYRLKFGASTGSPYIEYIDNPEFSSSVNVVIDQSQFKVYDEKGLTPLNDFLDFVYIQGDTVRFTDFNKEIAFARSIEKRKSVGYQQLATVIFTENNVQTRSSFALDPIDSDLSPYDWDWKKLPTTQINPDVEYYLIPRSIVDIEAIVGKHVGYQSATVMWPYISTKHIKIKDQTNLKGASYDPKQSSYGMSILWILDGRNQTLIKQNAFSGDEIQRYPLLCPSTTRTILRPSGLIPITSQGDKYKFVREGSNVEEVLADSSFGDVPWLPLDIDNFTDLRGLLAFKDHLFITGSTYFDPIFDRSVVPSGNSVGFLYWYPTNDLFYNYTMRRTNLQGPWYSQLSSGNLLPTDITAYEDGTFLIADAASNKIYSYNLAYDYALVQNSYDSETKVVLREKYTNVDL